MFDHMGIVVADLARSRAFYDAALAPLRIVGKPLFENLILYRKDGFIFSISTLGTTEPTAVHFAFTAKNRAEVEAFYQAGLAAGGRDNGPPGLRPQYEADYYAAFLHDPDGYNIEAVTRSPR